MKRLFGLALSVLVIGSMAQAKSIAEKHGFRSEAELRNYLSVAKVRVIEHDAAANPSAHLDAPLAQQPASSTLANDFFSSLGGVLAMPESPQAWVAFGSKLWAVIVENKPVVNLQATRITVLPNDRSAWAQMSGWRGPAAKSYSIVATNLYGIDVVKHTYTVAYNYGGSLNGKGAYLANATVIPTDVSVLWGYTLNSVGAVGDVLNTGSVESPVPGVDLQLKYQIKTLLKEDDTTESFFVRGDGSMTHTTKQN